jgi:hypothetical protein
MTGTVFVLHQSGSSFSDPGNLSRGGVEVGGNPFIAYPVPPLRRASLA